MGDQPSALAGPVTTEAKQIWPCSGPGDRISESPWPMDGSLEGVEGWKLPTGMLCRSRQRQDKRKKRKPRERVRRIAGSVWSQWPGGWRVEGEGVRRLHKVEREALSRSLSGLHQREVLPGVTCWCGIDSTVPLIPRCMYTRQRLTCLAPEGPVAGSWCFAS